MPTRTVTIESLITEYAAPIADTAGLNASDYDKTAGGLASLLREAAGDLSPMDQTREWLVGAAADLDAIARLGDNSAKAQGLLTRIDAALYEAKSDLDLA
jgi:hypothetical protein